MCVSQYSIYRIIFFILGFVLCINSAKAQLPNCSNGGIVYLQSGTIIYNYDPSQPVVTGVNPSVNSISLPPGAGGLAVSTNLSGVGASPTFYTTVSGNYYYYDGISWINTGHSTGNTAAVNIGAGGSYIYNLVGASGAIYKYDGTGNATLLTTVASFGGGGPYDLVGDISGNWYILKLTTPQTLEKYSATGTLINTWTVTGVTPGGAGPGFAVICDNIYVQGGGGTSGYYTGVINNTTNTINFTPGTVPITGAGDWANCPAGNGAGQASIDTGYYCGYGPGIAVSANGTGTVTWTVLSGNAVIAGSGNNITVTATSGISKILLSISGGLGLCGSGTDTVTIIVPTASLLVTPSPDSIKGCGTFLDTLNAFVSNVTPGVTYNYNWTPAATITSGANAANAIISPTANTTYVVTVNTPTTQGGCTWKDSVKTVIVDQSVTANYTFTIKYGCTADTVTFQNTSSPSVTYNWNFADGTTDTAKNPKHIYSSQGVYNVRLIISNGICKDTVINTINTQHPLIASFEPDDDSVCVGTPVLFTNTSTFSTIGGSVRFYWSLGDGSFDTTLSPSHTYTSAGTYTVALVVKDFVPCLDTAYHTIVVDTLPYLNFTLSDSILCEGEGVIFSADYSKSGNIGITWNFGDGNTAENRDQVLHAYDSAGIYTVNLAGNYRVCPNTAISKDIEVKPYPTINLGPDTTVCPGAYVGLADYKNQFALGATWIWNTGDTNYILAVDKPGMYTARVTIRGCSTEDTVEVFRDCFLEIPNTFTPNGDDLNDYFFPRNLLSKGLTTFKMSIYNRWGQVIFETTRTDGRGWDGKFNSKEQPVGAYIYIIDAAIKNGNTQHYQGNVTLLR
jgi:gliding motility-associated-like protein